MTVLLSNDDGVEAAGLIALEKEVSAKRSVHVVAPNKDRSGVSNCLTLDRPLHVHTLSNSYISVDGTPTDCVHLGTSELLIPLPERVLSGINHGANLGDDVLYSGTVAAAMEGRFLEKPAIAFSLVTGDYSEVLPDFSVAAKLAVEIMALIDGFNAPSRTVFNVNIPDVPRDQIKGVKMTTLGQRLKSESPILAQNPRGKTIYWIGRAGGPVDYAEGTDFLALQENYISITPLHADMSSAEFYQWTELSIDDVVLEVGGAS